MVPEVGVPLLPRVGVPFTGIHVQSTSISCELQPMALQGSAVTLGPCCFVIELCREVCREWCRELCHGNFWQLVCVVVSCVVVLCIPVLCRCVDPWLCAVMSAVC